MRILIVSDTHREDEALKLLLEENAPLDMLIHLGDAEGSEMMYKNWLPLSTRLIVLKGNNDFFSDLESERSIRIGNSNCLLTHFNNLWDGTFFYILCIYHLNTFCCLNPVVLHLFLLFYYLVLI